MMGPIVDEVAEERNDIIIGKLNVDTQPEIAMRYNVMSIPTLYYLKMVRKHRNLLDSYLRKSY